MKQVYAIILVVFLFGSCTRQSIPTAPTPISFEDTEFNYWIHSPIHPANNQPVTFKLSARDEALVTKVELIVYEYELYKNKDIPSKRRRSSGLWGSIKSWEFDMPQESVELQYDYLPGFNKHSNIEYIFQITNAAGGVSSRIASFDGGDSPWPKEKILLYTASTSGMDQTINVAFIKDVDFGSDWPRFFADVEHLVYNGYHQNNMIQAHKDKWSFYYTKEEANGHSIAHDALQKEIFPEFLTNYRIEGIDAYGLLHQQPFKDGAYLMGNLTFLSNNLFTSESYNIGTAVHETAHAIFNLSDEYEGCVCIQSNFGGNMFTKKSDCERFNERIGVGKGHCTKIANYERVPWYMAEENVYFDTQEECYAFAEANGYPKSDCIEFIDMSNKSFFRSESGLCIMQDDGDHIIRDFKRACSAVIMDYYKELGSDAISYAPSENRNNIFGYQPVVVMELSQKNNHIDSKIQNVHMGVPSKNWSPKRAYELDLCRKNKSSIMQINLSDPKMCIAHHCSGGDTIRVMNSFRKRIQVPYQEELSLLRCKFIPFGQESTSEKLSKDSYKEVEVDFKEQLQDAYRKFEQGVN